MEAKGLKSQCWQKKDDEECCSGVGSVRVIRSMNLLRRCRGKFNHAKRV